MSAYRYIIDHYRDFYGVCNLACYSLKSILCIFTFFIDGKECDYCQRTSRRKLSPVRRPYPNRNREGFHYCRVNDTPADDRAVDDFQPRAQLRKLFNEGNMSTDKHAFRCKNTHLLVSKAITIFTETYF